MASKSSNRGGGDGTSDRGGVRSTMTPPFTGGASTGSGNGMSAPFNAPRAGGDNGLPTTVYDDSMKSTAPKSTATSRRDSLGTIET